MRHQLARTTAFLTGFAILIGGGPLFASSATATTVSSTAETSVASSTMTENVGIEEYKEVYTSSSLTVPTRGLCYGWYCPPAPAPAPPPPAAPAPVDPPPYIESTDRDVRVEDGRYWTDFSWRQDSAGFMGYLDSPTFKSIDTETGVISYFSRPSYGAPYPPTSKGACNQVPGDIGPVAWGSGPADSGWDCVNGGDISRQNCAVAINNGYGPTDPRANYSYGSSWSYKIYQRDYIMYGHYEDVEHWVDKDANGNVQRRWTQNVNYHGSWDEKIGDDKNQWRVDWGACQFYSSPVMLDIVCMTSVQDAWSYGPYGLGLPARNGPGSNDIISTTISKTFDMVGAPLYTPLGDNFNGGRLYGRGPNAASVNLVLNCEEDGYVDLGNGPDATSGAQYAKMDSNGLYHWQMTSRQTLCHVIRYPGYGVDSFQGCDPQTTEISNQYYVKACGPAEITYDPDSWADYNFDPALCIQVGPGCVPDVLTNIQNTQEQTNGTETDLPTNRSYRDNYYSVVEADGRPISVNVPPVAINTSRGTRAVGGRQWTVWEVDSDSNPWAWDNTDDPNASDQPFAGRINGEDALVIVPGAMLPKDAFPNTLTWSKRARTLNLSFFRPGDEGDGRFNVRGHFSEQYDAVFSTEQITGTYRTARTTSSAGNITTTVAPTCTIPWQNFKVVAGRNTSGNTLGR